VVQAVVYRYLDAAIREVSELQPEVLPRLESQGQFNTYLANCCKEQITHEHMFYLPFLNLVE
jgi:hypothetical protein